MTLVAALISSTAKAPLAAVLMPANLGTLHDLACRRLTGEHRDAVVAIPDGVVSYMATSVAPSSVLAAILGCSAVNSTAALPPLAMSSQCRGSWA